MTTSTTNTNALSQLAADNSLSPEARVADLISVLTLDELVALRTVLRMFVLFDTDLPPWLERAATIVSATIEDKKRRQTPSFSSSYTPQKNYGKPPRTYKPYEPPKPVLPPKAGPSLKEMSHDIAASGGIAEVSEQFEEAIIKTAEPTTPPSGTGKAKVDPENCITLVEMMEFMRPKSTLMTVATTDEGKKWLGLTSTEDSLEEVLAVAAAQFAGDADMGVAAKWLRAKVVERGDAAGKTWYWPGLHPPEFLLEEYDAYSGLPYQYREQGQGH